MTKNMRDLSFATFNLYNLQVPGGITYDQDKPAIPDTEEGRCQRRSKIRPRGGAKLGHFGFTRDAGDERRPVSRALHVAGG